MLRDGRWVELFREVGYPAGLHHTMTLDVTGQAPARRPQDSASSSNMDLYWDRIFLAGAPGPGGALAQGSRRRSADLHFLGYPREYSPDGRQPNLDYYHNCDRAVPGSPWTATTPATARWPSLLGEADDCYVIMGPGEELTLRFPADAFGPVPPGCRRTFILKTDSYCKDMDLYTAYPDTVEPLPFHAMSGYPYGPDEHYPDTPKTRAYR